MMKHAGAEGANLAGAVQIPHLVKASHRRATYATLTRTCLLCCLPLLPCAGLRYAMLRYDVLSCPALGRAMQVWRSNVPPYASCPLCCAMLCCAVMCCAALCCTGLRRHPASGVGPLCCAMICSAMLPLRCAVQVYGVILPLESDPRSALRALAGAGAPPAPPGSSAGAGAGGLHSLTAALASLQQRLPGPVAQPPALVMEFVEGRSLRCVCIFGFCGGGLGWGGVGL